MEKINQQAFWVYHKSDGEEVYSQKFLSPPKDCTSMYFTAVSKISKKILRKPFIISYYDNDVKKFNEGIKNLSCLVGDLFNLSAKKLDTYICERKLRFGGVEQSCLIILDEYAISKFNGINVQIIHNQYKEIRNLICIFVDHYFKLNISFLSSFYFIDKTLSKISRGSGTICDSDSDFLEQKFKNRVNYLLNFQDVRSEYFQLSWCNYLKSLNKNQYPRDYHDIFVIINSFKYDLYLFFIYNKLNGLSFKKCKWQCNKMCPFKCGIANIKDINNDPFFINVSFPENKTRDIFNDFIDDFSFSEKTSIHLIYSYFIGCRLSSKMFKIDNNYFLTLNLAICSIIKTDFTTNNIIELINEYIPEENFTNKLTKNKLKSIKSTNYSINFIKDMSFECDDKIFTLNKSNPITILKNDKLLYDYNNILNINSLIFIRKNYLYKVLNDKHLRNDGYLKKLIFYEFDMLTVTAPI